MWQVILRRYSLSSTKSRIMIEAENVTKTPFEDYTRVITKSYDFLLAKDFSFKHLYEHRADTPAAVLLKQAIHILPTSMPVLNKAEKYAAITKLLQTHFADAYQKCTKPEEIFHMSRRIKTQIKHKLNSIGTVNTKYKHLMLFEPYSTTLKKNTIEQYKKKGVKVSVLDQTIFPCGDAQVWMPTDETYLKDFIKILKVSTQKQWSTILDLCSGSGILSFCVNSIFKNAHIWGIDHNHDAVQTYNINAARLDYRNAKAIVADLKNVHDWDLLIKTNQMPDKYDRILCNPPWMIAKTLPQQGPIATAVYDPNAELLKSCLHIIKMSLKDSSSRAILIYSDLSKILGLQKESLEQICVKLNLLIHETHRRPLPVKMVRNSVLTEYKAKSSIITYEIGLA